ncbi:DUF4132 domain-containing protein [Chondrinema litorale]|uniref:DUF4132 domain-containing protein n=1 Tax=Chondrinema litorale TaxID=2994555 RepID=UPI0025435F78|nr:DUF4132 domain-containing protein [Chondrinema litorale]UZR98761.1 DUF4132 domain-containing protein [Chondrinema litorale]
MTPSRIKKFQLQRNSQPNNNEQTNYEVVIDQLLKHKISMNHAFEKANTEEEKLEFLYSLLNYIQVKPTVYYSVKKIHELLRVFLKSEYKYSYQHLRDLTHAFIGADNEYQYQLPYQLLLDVFEKEIQENGLTNEVEVLLKELVITERRYFGAEEEKINRRIAILLSDKSTTLFEGNDALGHYLASQDYAKIEPVIQFLLKGSGNSKPTKKWLKEAEKLLKERKDDYLQEIIHVWFDITISTLGSIHKYWKEIDSYYFFGEKNIQIVRGAIWLCALINDDKLSAKIEEICHLSFKKIRGHGALSVKIGNAGLYTFSMLPAETGVFFITKVKMKTKYPSVQSHVERLLKEMAEAGGMDKEEIEEIAVPSYGLGEDFTYSEAFEKQSFTAEIKIESLKKVSLGWQNSNGKSQKSIPKILRTEKKADVKRIQELRKEIQEILIAQRDRIEELYLKKRRWSYAIWQKRYLNHAFIGFLAQKLIWVANTGEQSNAFIYLDGKFVNALNEEVKISEDTEIQLWHPIHSKETEISQWRAFMYQHQIQQPFKQAFREIYLVTEAEKNTFNYSNRFAAHILKQHQFTALCKHRGWSYSLMGDWDSHNTPVKRIPAWGISTEFWVDSNLQGIQTSGNGIFMYISTDQVRFYQDDRRLAMEEVPKIVFSEMMRDVDMFVGVTSIGNDTNWQDGGNNDMYTYWHSYSFGNLNEIAKTRKSILEQLVPKLKISDQCSFDGKFLIVDGQLKTYKIHLGSGNILMSPHDQYLCIVPDRNSDQEKVYLPFEGDQMISIILSKAFLLAEDHKITDQLILRQL